MELGTPAPPWFLKVGGVGLSLHLVSFHSKIGKLTFWASAASSKILAQSFNIFFSLEVALTF